jgi:dihydroorotase
MLFKNAKIVKESEIFEGDLRVEDGVIKEISNALTPHESEKVVEVEGRYLLPGLIDLNVRVTDDNLSETNLKTLSSEAKRGGVTTLLLMPNFSPEITDGTILQILKQRLKNSSDIEILVSAFSLLRDKERLNNIAKLINFGADAIYAHSDINGHLLNKIF